MLIALATLLTLKGYTQDYQGYRSGNYNGVNSVFFNPANIADSRYYFDVHLLSLSTLGANDRASYKLKNFSETFKSENLKGKLFGEKTGPTNGLFNVDIHGPSAMLGIGLKNSIAITSRARIFTNVINFDAKLVDQINNGLVRDPSLPYSFNYDQDMRFSMNAWTEYGASFGRILYDKGKHAIKAGITLKYLAGTANSFININKFRGRLNADQLLELPYLETSSGLINMGFSGAKIAGFGPGRFSKMSGSGFGTDLGFVYEYRPAANMQTTEGVRLDNNYKNLYKFKFGVSILDLGSILYKKDKNRSADYNINITDLERLYVDELENVDVDEYKSFFDKRPLLFNPVTSDPADEYNVSLPTTLQIEADYLINDGYYINLSSQISLSNNNTNFYNNRAYSGVTLTPRYEDKLIGIYLPVNYNSLTKLNAGLSFRVGPVFFGSGSLFTALFGSSKQADVHFGLRLGELK